MNDFLLEVKRFLKFSEKTFVLATAQSSLEKLKDEIKEVEKAGTSFEKREEYIDCIMCLFDAAKRDGIHPEFIIKGFTHKIDKNIARTWKANLDGTYSHVK